VFDRNRIGIVDIRRASLHGRILTLLSPGQMEKYAKDCDLTCGIEISLAFPI
jgi:hypothetical protein